MALFDILIMVAAAFIVYRLISILGRKDIDEGGSNIHIHPSAAQAKKRRNAAEAKSGGAQAKTVELDKSQYQEIDKDVPVHLKKPLEAIRKYDAHFSLEYFAGGAEQAFDMIVQAFAKGDKQTLKGLLAEDVYQAFEGEIAARADKDVEYHTTIVSVKVKVDDIKIDGTTAQVETVITSEQVNLEKKGGEVVAGDPSEIETVTDHWVFARNLNAKDPNWRLVCTN